MSDNQKNVNWYNNNSTGDSIYKENTSFYDNSNVIIKKTNTLDHFFKDKNISFDFIKIDVQGSEIPILKGGFKYYKKYKFYYVGDTIFRRI